MRKIFSIYIFLLEFFCFAEIPEEWGPVIRLKVTQHDKEQLEAVYNEGGYGLWGYTSFPMLSFSLPFQKKQFQEFEC